MAIKCSTDSCTEQLVPYLSMFLLDSDIDTKLPENAVMKVGWKFVDDFLFLLKCGCFTHSESLSFDQDTEK